MNLNKALPGIESVIAYSPDLAHMLKSAKTSLLLCQLLYWCDKGRESNGTIYKTMAELARETGLSEYEIVGARKTLRAMGIISEKKKKIPPRVHFSINGERLQDLWRLHLLSSEKVAIRRKKKSNNLDGNSLEFITESTQISPSKSTQRIPAEKPLASFDDINARHYEAELKLGRSQNSSFSHISQALIKYRPV